MLDYLFIAETFNNQIIHQTQADVSILDPTKSAYYDVTVNHIRKFTIFGKGNIFSVDLIDGHMEVNGNALYPPTPPPGNTPLKLIYYRTVQQRIQQGTDKNKILSPITRYYIGWETNKNGKNQKWELGID